MPPVLLRSPLLDSLNIPHAFTTRQGGVSPAPFASLNLGNPSDIPAERRDPSTNIRENWRLILAAINCGSRRLVEVHQVHGAAVHVIRERTPLASPDPRADAIVTDHPSLVPAVRVADCCPVLLSSHDGRVVAVAHAGWRGVIAGVIPATVKSMQQLGADSLAAAIGPCIGPDRFEVGPEVVEQFRAAFPSGETVTLHPTSPGKGLIDLKAALRLQLQRSGVDRIDTLPQCTYRDADLFYSHRREKGLTGRTAALISPRA